MLHLGNKSMLANTSGSNNETEHRRPVERQLNVATLLTLSKRWFDPLTTLNYPQTEPTARRAFT